MSSAKLQINTVIHGVFTNATPLPHQGIDNRTVLGSSNVPTATGNVVRIPRVGGLLNHYERVA
jgi:hypothetical protein